MAKAILRYLAIIHRWIGIVACLLFVIWFGSAIVLMYVHFPAMKTAEKLVTLPDIRWDSVKTTPEEAIGAAGFSEFPAKLWLEMSGDEPVYRMHDWDDADFAVSARDGSRIGSVTGDEALRTVQLNLSAPDATLLKENMNSDQWTVTGYWDQLRPFHVVALNDAADTHYYVAVDTGEIVLDTVRWERFWNYLGAVPHWMYFEFIRWDTDLWFWVVIVLSGIGIVGAASGLWLGVTRMRLRRARRYGGTRVSPFVSWMKWHHVAGLVGGVFLFAWIVTGLLSMYPGGFLEQREVTPTEYQRLAGNTAPRFPSSNFSAISDRNQAASYAKFFWLNGEPLILLHDKEMNATVIDGESGLTRRLTQADLSAAAKNLMPDANLVASDYLTEGTEYWHTAFREMRLPIIQVKFDDDAGTWFYINPETAAVEGILDKIGRLDRWANWGVHDVDLLFLHENRPLWDIVVLALLLAGLFISSSGVVIGAKRLAFNFRANRRRRSIARRGESSANGRQPA